MLPVAKILTDEQIAETLFGVHEDYTYWGKGKAVSTINIFPTLNKFLEVCDAHYQAEHKRVVEKLKELLITCHQYLDNVNALQGKPSELCMVCHSYRHDGTGIIHKSDCLILKIRKYLGTGEGNEQVRRS